MIQSLHSVTLINHFISVNSYQSIIHCNQSFSWLGENETRMQLSRRPSRCPKCFSYKVSDYDEHRQNHSLCYDCQNEFTIENEKRDLFHRLWSQAAQNKYDRALWNRLSQITGW